MVKRITKPVLLHLRKKGNIDKSVLSIAQFKLWCVSSYKKLIYYFYHYRVIEEKNVIPKRNIDILEPTLIYRQN